MAGLVTAWLIDGTHEAVVFEARERIGGNARSVSVHLGGEPVWFDLGTQEISEEEYPLNSRLMRFHGFRKRDLVEVPGSRTVLREDGEDPLLVGPHGPNAGWTRSEVLGEHWERLAAFLRHAWRWDEEELDWEIPLVDMMDSLEVPEGEPRDLLCALPAALFGCDLREAGRLSARAATAPFLGGDDRERAPATENLRGGLESLAWALATDLRLAEIRPGTGIIGVRARGSGYELVDTAGEVTEVDAVVLAVPPPVAAGIVAALDDSSELRRTLGAFPYREVSYALHRDPSYMPEKLEHWSTNNVTIGQGWSESTTWYGAVHGMDVFKSQVTRRTVRPRRVLARETFEQLIPTPEVFRAQARLSEFQGCGGLYFAGHYTAGIDSQETTVESASRVARMLAPRSPRVTALLDTEEEPADVR